MNEFIKNVLGHIKDLWGKWSMPQRIILIGIVAAVIGGMVALFNVSSAPALAPVIDAPIRDEAARDRIIMRINEEGVKASASADGLVLVADENTARRMRAILIQEDLVPKGIDPWNIFDRERWSITDFERNVNFRRAQTAMIREHIKAINDIDDANVVIEVPEKELFLADQKPVSASVIITPSPGSDIRENRKKVEGIQRLLKLAIAGLTDEHIVITDHTGMEAMDRQNLIERQHKFIQTQEAKYRELVLGALQQTFTADRVRDLNIKIEMDMSTKTISKTEVSPVVIKPRTPGLSYDDSVMKDSLTVSESVSETNWEGSGMNPEGPAGVEGQTPPAFKDMSNLYGKMTQNTRTHNEEINKEITQGEKSPQIDRVTVSVIIDGKWKWKYSEKGDPVILADGAIEREYIAVPAEELKAAEAVIRDAVGYNSARQDSVTVRNIAFDRTEQFRAEDAAYFRKKQMQTTLIVFLAGLTFLLLGFIIFRIVARELERRRRLADEERARREQALRESALAEAEQEGVDVSISVEERTRMELMESVVNMAKEHPEDCAQLIRTWLLED